MQLLHTTTTVSCTKGVQAWPAQPGGVGDNVPLTFGTSGVQGAVQ